MTTKKFTFMESQRSLRSDVMRAVKLSEPTWKVSSSPSFQPRRFAMPSSTDSARSFGPNHLPGHDLVVARQLAHIGKVEFALHQPLRALLGVVRFAHRGLFTATRRPRTIG